MTPAGIPPTAPRWLCAKDGTPVQADAFEMWCPTCQDTTIAVKAEPIRREQYYAICRYFKSRGWLNRALRMRKLTELTGRPITDYFDLTAAEAERAEAALKEWAHGK